MFAKSTGSAEAARVVLRVRDDIRLMTNLTRLVELTPIANLTQRIQWDSVENLAKQILETLGLEATIDPKRVVEGLKNLTQRLEDSLEDPEALVQDLLGFNTTQVVEDFLTKQLGLPDIDLDKFDLKYLGYMPIFDPFGAYYFFPDHCYPNRNNKPGRYQSPIIGYVKTGASIEQDIVE